MPRAIQRFEVSLKAFIVDGAIVDGAIIDGGRALFVRESDTGFWELPGGRIDVGEEWLAHADVLAREIREELGDVFKVAFGAEVVTWTRLRPTDGAYLFLVARKGRFMSGAPVLSGEHDAFGWFTRDEAAQLGFPEASGYREGLAALWCLTAPA